jgi:hypothetical protein
VEDKASPLTCESATLADGGGSEYDVAAGEAVITHPAF